MLWLHVNTRSSKQNYVRLVYRKNKTTTKHLRALVLVSEEISGKYKNQHKIKNLTLKRGLKQSWERKQSCYRRRNFSCDDFVWVKSSPRGGGGVLEGGGTSCIYYIHHHNSNYVHSISLSTRTVFH